MLKTTGTRLGALALGILFAAAAAAAEPQTVDLIQQGSVKLIREASATSGEWRDARDGSAATAWALKSDGTPIEFVLQVSDKIATAHSWSVTLGRNTKPVRVEILASTLSPQSGFALLRGDTVAPKTSGKRLTFRARGVKYLLFRFTPMNAKAVVEVAELSVSGQLAPPATKYSFTESPARALDVLARLKKSDELMITITKDEAGLFADARDGRLDDWSLAEAMLLASGVTDASRRARLLRQIDSLEEQARAAVQGAKTPFERGDKLLRWLHRDNGPLAAGYESHQTRLDVLLEKKSFNCVSSAAMFAILALRLGLDARAVEVPDHAFAIVYDGAKHADVETTNAGGFNPARDRAAQEAFKAQTGLSYIPDSHRDKRREIDAAGLVAITYYNRGVMFTGRKQHHRALLAYFRAMSMDAEFNSAVKNALAGLVNWGNELLDQKEYASAVKVIETGLALAPMDASLRHNQEVAYTKWAVSLADRNRNDDALEILRTAAKSAAEGDFVEMQGWIFMNQGEKLVAKKDWPSALASADEGLAKVDDAAKPDIQDWRQGVLLRWSNDRLKAKDFAKALSLVEDGHSRQPKDRRFLNNIAFVVQEWAGDLHKTKGAEAAREMLLAVAKKHSKLDGVQRVTSNFARNGYIELRNAKKFDEAAEWIDGNRELLAEKDWTGLQKDLLHAVSRRWIDKKDWGKAEVELGRALKTFPKEGRFQQNLAFVVQNRANELLRTKGPHQARDELLRLRTQYEKISRVARALEGVVHSTVARSLDQAPKDPWTCYDSLQGVLPESRDAALVRIVTDQLANPHYKAKNWEKAIAIYDQGLKRLPKDRHIRNNSLATWHAWARVSVDKKDWKTAIDVYEQALKRFPNERSFKQNLDYCKDQIKQ